MKSTLNILAKIVRRADIARAIQSYIYNLAENVAAIRQKVLTGYPHNIKLNKYIFIDFFFAKKNDKEPVGAFLQRKVNQACLALYNLHEVQLPKETPLLLLESICHHF